MVTIELEMFVHAPAERVFDLARSVDLHVRSTGGTREQAVAGRTTGLLEPGETVTWRARHLGAWRKLTSRVSTYERPRHFRDEMVSGAFAWLEHDHFFDPVPGGTLMRDVFRFAAPLGPLGWLAERLLLERYMARFLAERNAVIKQVAESDEWHPLLEGG